MDGNVKKLIGGVALGLLILFAIIGVMSLLTRDKPRTEIGQQRFSPAVTTYNTSTPQLDADAGSRLASQQDTRAPTEEDTRVELVNEPQAPVARTVEDTEPTLEELAQSTLRDMPPPETLLPTYKPTAPQPQAPTKNDNIPLAPPAPVTAPATEKPATPSAPSASNGSLEIVSQTAENGMPIKANVYIQQANGTQIDKATYTAKATFSLKPGTYKVTVRAEGRGSLSRTITLPAQAVVNEIFPLPAISNRPSTTAPPASQPPAAPASTPVASAGTGKLRVVALAAEDGQPLQVNFTVSRPNGAIIQQFNHVAMAELAVPAQEVTVQFNYQGFQGEKRLQVTQGQTVTHTFNIKGTHQPDPPSPVPAPQPVPPQAPSPAQQGQPQPGNLQDMLMQRLQQELNKRLNN